MRKKVFDHYKNYVIAFIIFSYSYYFLNDQLKSNKELLQHDYNFNRKKFKYQNRISKKCFIELKRVFNSITLNVSVRQSSPPPQPQSVVQRRREFSNNAEWKAPACMSNITHIFELRAYVQMPSSKTLHQLL